MDQLSPFRASTDSKSLLGFIDQRQPDTVGYGVAQDTSRLTRHNESMMAEYEPNNRIGSSVGPDKPLNIQIRLS